MHGETIPLADLLLTKVQVAEPKRTADVTDTFALLLDHELATDESAINVNRVCDVLSHDYRWWLVATTLLGRLTGAVGEWDLPESASTIIAARLDGLSKALHECPKSLSWRARAQLDGTQAERAAAALWRIRQPDHRRSTTDTGPDGSNARVSERR